MRHRYQRGDVLLVEMPFTDGPGGKKRPAVVLSTEAFNAAGTKIIVAAITSNLTAPFRPGDTTVGDWQAAGLLKPSAVRGYLGMADQRHIERSLGKMTDADFTQVEQGVATILGFSVPERK
jgi:mRNA interferase MazF